MAITQRSVELVIPREAWESAGRSLLLDPGQLATGSLRVNQTNTAHELLIDRLELVRELPTGDLRPPLDDWVVFRVEASVAGAESSADFIHRLRPRASQRVIVVSLLRGHDRQAWDGAVFEEGRVFPLSGLRVVGPGALHLERHPTPDEELTKVQAARWSRTVGAVGSRVFERIRRATVTLIGAGRTGSMLAFHLTALGVGRLRIVDGDRLGIENLDAMPGLAVTDVGRPKATALGHRLREFQPDLAVTCCDKSYIDPQLWKSLRGQRSDLIVTCVDNDTPRLAASLQARRELTPHLDVGTSIQPSENDEQTMTGDVRLLLPGSGCVSCVGGLQDPVATLYELSAPPGSLRRGRSRAWHEERAGSLISLNSMTVGIAVQTWLDLLAGTLNSSYWHRLRWEYGAGLMVDAGAVGADDDCRFCHAQ